MKQNKLPMIKGLVHETDKVFDLVTGLTFRQELKILVSESDINIEKLKKTPTVKILDIPMESAGNKGAELDKEAINRLGELAKRSKSTYFAYLVQHPEGVRTYNYNVEDMRRIATNSLAENKGSDSKTSNKEKFPRLSVAAIFRYRQLENTTQGLLLLVIALLVSFILSGFQIIEWGAIQISLFVSLVLLFVRQSILDYRILKGFYGNNELEARELIAFILKESSNIDFTDNGKPKKILSFEDLEEIKKVAPQAVPGLAISGGVK